MNAPLPDKAHRSQIEADDWAAALRAEREAFRAQFLKDLADSDEARKLFASLPGSDFYIKDLAGRYVHASAGILEGFGRAQTWEIIGTRDEDHLPGELAAAEREEDQSIFSTGEAIQGRLDLRWRSNPGLVWYETSKYPLWDDRRKPFGLIGVERPLQGDGCTTHDHLPVPVPPLRDPRLAKALDYIFLRCDRTHSNAEIAKAAEISERQLSRLFLRHFRTTPARFCCLVRAQLACKRLAETDDPIEAIAHDFGFADQSSFTNRFRSLIGTTPGKFRKRQRKRQELG